MLIFFIFVIYDSDNNDDLEMSKDFDSRNNVLNSAVILLCDITFFFIILCSCKLMFCY